MKDLISCDKATIARLANGLKHADSHSQYQRIQCVLIRATLGSSAAQIAELLGWSTATVHVMHSRWAKEGDSIFEMRGRGGRHHQHLSAEEEALVLAPFIAQARSGGMLKVAQIQQAYEQKVDKEVAPSTIYRLLDRHARLNAAARVRLMFQDEGRFGLLGKPRRCWAPKGTRPIAGARLERKYIYAFATVSPHDGVMDSHVLAPTEN